MEVSVDTIYLRPWVCKYRAPGRCGDCVFYAGAQYLYILTMELVLFHRPRALNFEAAPTFLENLSTLAQDSIIFLSYLLLV
jgi:hypothetical protein